MTVTIGQEAINVLVLVFKIVSYVLMLLNQVHFALLAEMVRFIHKANQARETSSSSRYVLIG